MRYLSLLFVLSAFFGAFSSEAVFQPDMPPNAVPGEIVNLRAPLQKAPRENYEEIITKQLGKPEEHGKLLIWKVAGGILTMTRPGIAPPVFNSAKYAPYCLLNTHNPALEALTDGAFHLSSGPTKGHPRVYMGIINILNNTTYLYRRGKTDQPATFFEENPKGTVAIKYSEGASAESPLESLPNGTVFAEITYTSQDQKNSIVLKYRLSKQHAIYLIDDPAFNFDSGSSKGWPHNFPPGIEK